MGKKDICYTYKKATVDLDDLTIAEHLDNGIHVHNLKELLQELAENGIQDLSIKSNVSVDGKLDE